jgi:hypothetical protein
MCVCARSERYTRNVSATRTAAKFACCISTCGLCVLRGATLRLALCEAHTPDRIELPWRQSRNSSVEMASQKIPAKLGQTAAGAAARIRVRWPQLPWMQAFA